MPSRSKSRSKSPKKPIDILVPCHSYLNKTLKYGAPIHKPVFLFLYNKETKEYEKINITDVKEDYYDPPIMEKMNLLNVLLDHNINIIFIDTGVNDADVIPKGEWDEPHQYNDIKKLEETGLKFDYIFPIHCERSDHLKYIPFLKDSGKLLYPDIQYDPEYIKYTTKKDVIRNFIKENRSKIPAKDAKGNDQIEFQAYLKTHELYIYKDDLGDDDYLGVYKIFGPEQKKTSASKKSGGRRTKRYRRKVNKTRRKVNKTKRRPTRK